MARHLDLTRDVEVVARNMQRAMDVVVQFVESGTSAHNRHRAVLSATGSPEATARLISGLLYLVEDMLASLSAAKKTSSEQELRRVGAALRRAVDQTERLQRQ